MGEGLFEKSKLELTSGEEDVTWLEGDTSSCGGDWMGGGGAWASTLRSLVRLTDGDIRLSFEAQKAPPTPMRRSPKGSGNSSELARQRQRARTP